MARSKQSTKVATKPVGSKDKKVAPATKEAVADTIVVSSPKKSPGKKSAAPKKTEAAVAKKEPVSDSPYQLDSAKVLRACTALKAYLEASKDPAAKPNLLDDPEAPSASAVTIWLNLTTKKYISDTRKLKPTPIPLPHSLASPTATAILIVKEPQRHYKDLVATAGLTSTITKVVDVAKLKAKFKSFESKRQLAESHDVFLADDRIVTTLPKILGKSIYKRSAQIPIPLSLAETTSPAQLTKAVRKALDSTYLHLSPAASTSVRVALSSHTPEAMAANIIAAVSVLTESKIPGGWRNIRSLHIKSPESAALPIWMAEELYSDEDVLAAGEAEAVAAAKEKEKEDRKTRKIEKRKKRKSEALDGADEQSPKKAKVEEEVAAPAAAPEPIVADTVDEEAEVEVPSDVEVEIEEEEKAEKVEKADKKKAEPKKASKPKKAGGEKRKTRASSKGKRS